MPEHGESESEMLMPTWDREVDVLIAGHGCAGELGSMWGLIYQGAGNIG